MAGWVKAPNIVSLFDSVNKIAPSRDKASDGTVGDLEHQQGVSGHNPDDYPGVTAERSDSDNIPEVRAGDIDIDLKVPGLTMEMLVQAVLKSTDKNRLIYIIYNKRIWEKSNGWKQRTYTGSNPHDKHAHFSGDPASDNDSRPWPSIEALGSGSTGGWETLFSKFGDKGEHVQFAQIMLNQAGFGPIDEDGDYGPGTKAAVIKARKAVGSTVLDGMVIDAHALNQIMIGFVRKWSPAGARGPAGPKGDPGPATGELAFPMTVVFNGTINKA